MWNSYNEQDGKIIIGHHDDIEPHLDYAAAVRSNYCRVAKKPDLHRVMRIPHVEIMKIMDRTGLNFFDPDHWPEIEKILRTDPYYKAFRTSEGNW